MRMRSTTCWRRQDGMRPSAGSRLENPRNTQRKRVRPLTVGRQCGAIWMEGGGERSSNAQDGQKRWRAWCIACQEIGYAVLHHASKEEIQDRNGLDAVVLVGPRHPGALGKGCIEVIVKEAEPGDFVAFQIMTVTDVWRRLIKSHKHDR